MDNSQSIKSDTKERVVGEKFYTDKPLISGVEFDDSVEAVDTGSQGDLITTLSLNVSAPIVILISATYSVTLSALGATGTGFSGIFVDGIGSISQTLSISDAKTSRIVVLAELDTGLHTLGLSLWTTDTMGGLPTMVIEERNLSFFTLAYI